MPVLWGVFMGTQCLAKAGWCRCAGLFLLFPRDTVIPKKCSEKTSFLFRTNGVGKNYVCYEKI
jgi:hypothetical protein